MSTEIVVVGDGPAGSALAAACVRRGLDVALVGDGAPWSQTLASFVDDLDTPDVATLFGRPSSAPPHALFARIVDGVAVWGHRHHRIGRAYGVLDNDYARRELQRSVRLVRGRAVAVSRVGSAPAIVRLRDGTEIEAAVVIDAAGRSDWRGAPPVARARQVAWGVVVPDLPADIGGTTFMDFRPAGLDDSTSTFCYVVPVPDGWLVEETVLATRTTVDPGVLRGRLAERLGCSEADLERAGRTESVDIVLAGDRQRSTAAVATFGAAAGYVHPATGYSVATSLRRAVRVADAIGGVVRGDLAPSAIDEIVWTRQMRVTRRLHRYGLETLVRLEPAEVRTFFDTFFDLPIAVWAPYLRVDADPREVATTMRHVFSRAPRTLRRQLVTSMPSWALSAAATSARRWRS